MSITNTILTNNAGIVYNEQKPDHVTTFFDSTTQKITWRDGDGLDVMIYFTAVPSAQNQYLEIWVDIWGAIWELYRDTITFPKGAWVEKPILYWLPSAYTRNTFEANWGTVYVRSDADLQIYKKNFNFDCSHKARI